MWRARRARLCSSASTQNRLARVMRSTYGFKIIRSQYADRGYEAYFVFDADNVLDVNYFREMNKTFDDGCEGVHELPQLQELRLQLDFCWLRRVVPARGQVLEPGAPHAEHQLRSVGHGLLHRSGYHREERRLEMAPAYRGHRVLRRTASSQGDSHRLLLRRPCSTTSSPLPFAIPGTNASAGRRASTRCFGTMALALRRASSPTPKVPASPATTCS